MPVMGPSEPPKELVDSAYNHILEFLKTNHRIQYFPCESSYPDWGKERRERNKALYDAVYNLFELHSWEAW